MALVKFNPRHSGSVDNVFDNLLNDIFEAPKAQVFVPSADIVESDKAYAVSLALPGVAKNDIEINVDKDRLTIKGKRVSKELKEGEKLTKREMRYGQFERNFYLPEDALAEEINATYELGVLQLEIPKDVKKNVKKTIEVK